MALLSIAVLLAVMVAGSYQHGMLMEPVNRASAFRVGFGTPQDYSDNQQWCGGRWRQWGANGGKCGECGDDYSMARPRPHENGGLYGTGVIVQSYAAGSTFTAVARITANHNGRFYFKLCPLASRGQLETQECFDKYPLRTVSGDTTYPLPNSNSADFKVQLVLPAGVKCEQCVLQWTYVTANSWGTCENGTSTLGCGPQEHFRTCSDIAIY